jgi:hypothetical protein
MPSADMDMFKGFAQSRLGKGLTLGAILLCALAILYVVRRQVSPSEAGSLSADRLFVCASTGKPFRYTIKIGTRIPVVSPYSGQATGYEAELCYWTREGIAKATPTPVLLNNYLGKTDATFCPDCGRLVVPQNPPPREGGKPPPTQEEYLARQKNVLSEQKSNSNEHDFKSSGVSGRE